MVGIPPRVTCASGLAVDAETHGVQFREKGAQRQRQRAADLPALHAGRLRRRKRLAAQVELQHALARVGDGEHRRARQQRAVGEGRGAGERRRAGAELGDEGFDEAIAREGHFPHLRQQPLAVCGGEVERRRARDRRLRVAQIAVGLGLHLRPDGRDVRLHLGEHAAGQAEKALLAAADEHAHAFDAIQLQERAGDGQVHAQKFLFALHVAGVDGEVHRHQPAGELAGDHPRVAGDHAGLRRAAGGARAGPRAPRPAAPRRFAPAACAWPGKGKRRRWRHSRAWPRKSTPPWPRPAAFAALRPPAQAARPRQARRWARRTSVRISASARFMRITRFQGRRGRRYFVMMGSSMMNVVPLFSSLSARMSPSCKSTIWRTMDRPRPVPPVSRERALSTR